MAVAVVERLKEESMCMDYPSAKTRKSSPCREVAVVERWPLVETVIIIKRRTRTRRRGRIIVLTL